MPQYHAFFATCPKGLETLLSQELDNMGAIKTKQTVAGVHFDGDLELAYRCCLWSRLANKVLMPLASGPCQDVENLYQGVKAVRWEQHLAVDGTFCIDYSGQLNGIKHSHFGALKAKDAIADYFTEREGRRPDVNANRPDVRVNVRVHKGIITVALDLSGDSLHKRGYRTQGAAAPLKENLAAAILLRADWPAIAARGGALIDPMCGSGTLLVEAALMFGNIAPGLDRQYWGFDGWKGHQARLWFRLVESAEQQRDKALSQQWPLIIGYDLSSKAVAAARDNIARAGLSKQIKVLKKPLNQLTHPGDIAANKGLVIANPPYGERLGDERELVELYRELGKRLQQHFIGWQAAVFTSNVELGKKIPLHSHKQYKLFNGAIASKLLMFAIDPDNFIDSQRTRRPDTPTASGQPLSEGAQMFANRLRKNHKKLKKWVKQHQIDAYRLYDADLPEYNAAIDCYNDWVHVAEYAPPATVDAMTAQNRLQEMIRAIPEALDIPPRHIALKQRRRQKGEQQYQRHCESGEFIEVREGAAKLLVNLTDYLDTGLFLDHRPVRLYIGQHVNNKRFLNLFCYTGAVSVHAALGAAKSIVNVDLSRTYLDWSKKNMQLNHIDDKRYQLIRADARQWLSQCDQYYDVIFLDPPTFSNSKKMQGVLDVQRDHVQLIEAAMQRLAEGGLLIFSTNQQRFKLDKAALAHYSLQDKTAWSIDRDFERSRHIHQCWFIRHG